MIDEETRKEFEFNRQENIRLAEKRFLVEPRRGIAWKPDVTPGFTLRFPAAAKAAKLDE